MERPLLFHRNVELIDGTARLAGFNVDPETWLVDWMLLERGPFFMPKTKRVEAGALTEAAHTARFDAAWVDLPPFDAHHQHALLRPPSRVHFMDLSGRSRVSADLQGALLDEELRCAYFVIHLHERQLLLPAGAAQLQNEEWLYVDVASCPPDSLAEYFGPEGAVVRERVA
jgi:hypothetical protein